MAQKVKITKDVRVKQMVDGLLPYLAKLSPQEAEARLTAAEKELAAIQSSARGSKKVPA